MVPSNLFHDLPSSLPEELFTTLWAAKGIRIERIVSQGHASPPGFWYDQDQVEWVLVLRGEAHLVLEGHDTTIVMKPGDHLLIPPHQRHRVAWTTPDESTIWLAVFYDAL